MNHKNLNSLISIVLFISGVHSVQIVKQNHESVTVEQGEQVQLICTSDVEVKTCTFRSPKGTDLPFFGAEYENGRLKRYEGKENDCGIVIENVRDEDNGIWECTVGGISESGEASSGKSDIEVVVAVPPTDVHLKIGDQVGLSEYQVKMEEHGNGEPVLVECVAENARPAPSFTWSIGDTNPINGQVETVSEEGENGKAKYVQTLKYYPKPGHNDQELRCVVDHRGYQEEQLASEDNKASLNLFILYAPVEAKKDEIFYDLKEGQANEIRMQIYANPKPTEGIWKLGDQELAVGAESVDKKYRSTPLAEGAVDGQWIVTLTINELTKEDSQLKNQLQISNNEGTAVYGFKLALGAKPPSESSSGLAIGVVAVIALIVLLLILVVVARSKGMLCFAGKRDEETEQTVDKEGSDTESAEHHKADDEKEVEGGEAKTNGAAAGGDDTNDVSQKKKSTLGSKVSGFLAAMRKSVKSSKDKYGETESEMKLNEGEEKKDPENGEKDDITYADLDKDVLASGPRKSSLTVEDEKTQYAEIKTPQ